MFLHPNVDEINVVDSGVSKVKEKFGFFRSNGISLIHTLLVKIHFKRFWKQRVC